jgi:hypothetical protein
LSVFSTNLDMRVISRSPAVGRAQVQATTVLAVASSPICLFGVLDSSTACPLCPTGNR